MFDWHATIEGLRPISKKNSRMIVHNRSMPSQAYKKFNAAAVAELRGLAPTEPYAGDVIIEIEVHLKGRLTSDIDNFTSSWLDTLMDAGVIADDDQVIECHVFKHRGAPDWRSEIHVVGVE